MMDQRAAIPWFAVLAVAACIPAALLDRAQFFHSALFAFMLWLGVSLGALAQLMLHHLTAGRWGFIVQRILEAALFPLSVLALCFAGILWGLPQLRHGSGYFAPGWVIGRAVACFAVWIWLSWRLRSLSIRQDAEESPTPLLRIRTLSGPGLILYFLTLSLAMFDWVMQLQPEWRSTMFPVIIAATQTLLALSLATAAVVFLLPRDRRIDQLAVTSGWHDLGKLLFAFVIFWTYVAFSQFLIIWCGNLPEEAAWYLARNRGGWEWFARILGAVCFAGPAAVLLAQPPKKNRRTLAAIALWIAAAQTAYLFWVVAPAFYPAFHLSWMDLLLPIAMGGIWLFFFLMGWRSADPIPRHDPRLAELEARTP